MGKTHQNQSCATLTKQGTKCKNYCTENQFCGVHYQKEAELVPRTKRTREKKTHPAAEEKRLQAFQFLKNEYNDRQNEIKSLMEQKLRDVKDPNTKRKLKVQKDIFQAFKARIVGYLTNKEKLETFLQEWEERKGYSLDELKQNENDDYNDLLDDLWTYEEKFLTVKAKKAQKIIGKFIWDFFERHLDWALQLKKHEFDRNWPPK
jgi:hypothetical protein